MIHMDDSGQMNGSQLTNKITKEQIQRFRSACLFIRIRYICSPFRLEMLKKKIILNTFALWLK